jgi:DNA-binding SARP family transcriptional activator/streptogramin lyase
MDFHLLGPLEVFDGDRAVRVGEGRQRSVLAFLLLHHDELVTTDRLIDALWGERPPPTAGKVLQNQVAQLRRALGDRDATLLQTHGHGYALHLVGGRLDVELFEELVREGDAAMADDDPGHASRALTAALAQWRGPALTEFAYEPFARPEIARLEEERVAAVEQRVDADLALGRHAALVPELEGLVEEHPARERLRAQLMLALYRSGRQGDALDTYRQGRTALLDALGVETGPALRELEAGILRQDPELAPEPHHWPSVKGHPWRPAIGLLLMGGALLVVAAVAAALLAAAHRPATAPARIPAGSVGAVDPASGRVLGSVSVHGVPGALAATRDRLWVSSDAGTLTGIDARRRSIAEVIARGGDHDAVAAADGSLWSTDVARRELRQVQPRYGTVVRRTRLPAPALAGGPSEIAVGGGAVWLIDGSTMLIRVDERTGRLRRFDVHRPLNDVAYLDGTVWLTSGASGSVLGFNPRRPVAPVAIPIAGGRNLEPSYPIAVARGMGSIWVLNGNTATVTRIDPVQLAPIATYRIGIERSPKRLTAGLGAVWVGNDDGTLARLDPSGGTPRVLAVAPGIKDVAIAGGAVWVSAR